MEIAAPSRVEQAFWFLGTVNGLMRVVSQQRSREATKGGVHILHHQHPLYVLTKKIPVFLLSYERTFLSCLFCVSCPKEQLPLEASCVAFWTARCVPSVPSLIWIWSFLCQKISITMSAERILKIYEMWFSKIHIRDIKVRLFFYAPLLF